MSVISDDELPFDSPYDEPDDLTEGAVLEAENFYLKDIVPADHPHWVKFYVDGGIFMAGRHTRRTRGVYWSVRCEDPSKPREVIIRKQDTVRYKTNNDAEWLAVREALQYAVENGVSNQPIVIYSDSQLVVKQFNGEYRTKIERHHRFRTECKLLTEKLKFVVLQWVPRSVNVEKLGH
jgi:ribonuclease HI